MSLGMVKDVTLFTSVFRQLCTRIQPNAFKNLHLLHQNYGTPVLKYTEKERKSRVASIVGEIGSPQPFTAKVLQRLSKTRLIRSSPGPGGGYYFPESSDYTLTNLRILRSLNHLFELPIVHEFTHSIHCC